MALCTLYDNFVSGELCEARQESILHVLRFPRRLIFHFIWFLLSRLVFGFLVNQGDALVLFPNSFATPLATRICQFATKVPE